MGVGQAGLEEGSRDQRKGVPNVFLNQCPWLQGEGGFVGSRSQI